MKTILFLLVIMSFTKYINSQTNDSLIGTWNEIDGSGYFEFHDDGYGRLSHYWEICGGGVSSNFKYKVINNVIYIQTIEGHSMCSNLYLAAFYFKNSFLYLLDYKDINNTQHHHRFLKKL